MSNTVILQGLKKRKQELEMELKKVNNAIDALVPPSPHFMQWKERSLICIENIGHIVRTTDILTCLLGEEEYNNLTPELRRKYITGLSVALIGLHTEGKIIKFFLKGFKGDFYAMPSWFDGSILNRKNIPTTLKKIIDVQKELVLK